MKLCFILFWSLLSFSPQSDTNTITIGKTIECIETEYVFSNASSIDIPLTHVFTLTNISQNKFRIKHVITTCSCVSAKWDMREIHPGETAQITISFLDKQFEGEFSKSAIVYISSLDRPFSLKIKGNIVNDLAK